jgi:hypothetical protein
MELARKRSMNATDAADLIDRLLDGNSRYPQVWNDFVPAATNRMTSIGSCAPTYDANRNTTYDCIHNYGRMGHRIDEYLTGLQPAGGVAHKSFEFSRN